MAIEMKKTLENGITLENAYVKIIAVNILTNIKTAYLDVFIYKDAETRAEDLSPVTTWSCSIYPDKWDSFYNLENMNKEGSNVISMSYDYLKTLPDFTGCVDC